MDESRANSPWILRIRERAHARAAKVGPVIYNQLKRAAIDGKAETALPTRLEISEEGNFR